MLDATAQETMFEAMFINSVLSFWSCDAASIIGYSAVLINRTSAFAASNETKCFQMLNILKSPSVSSVKARRCMLHIHRKFCD